MRQQRRLSTPSQALTNGAGRASLAAGPGRPVDSSMSLRHASGMFERASSPRRQQQQAESALLVAALEHSWASYDARLNRGLQVVNYYLVAIAILANAYVDAFNTKLYAVAAVIGVSGVAISVVTLVVGVRQRQLAKSVERSLIELQDRVAGRIGIGSFRIQQAMSRKSRLRSTPVSYVAIALAVLLSTAAVAYALIH